VLVCLSTRREGTDAGGGEERTRREDLRERETGGRCRVEGEGEGAGRCVAAPIRNGRGRFAVYVRLEKTS
jgi:DNA-binding IclR family transcriptional regulator